MAIRVTLRTEWQTHRKLDSRGMTLEEVYQFVHTLMKAEVRAETPIVAAVTPDGRLTSMYCTTIQRPEDYSQVGIDCRVPQNLDDD